MNKYKIKTKHIPTQIHKGDIDSTKIGKIILDIQGEKKEDIACLV